MSEKFQQGFSSNKKYTFKMNVTIVLPNFAFDVIYTGNKKIVFR